MAFNTPRRKWRARVWIMNITLPEEIAFREALKEQWGKWQRYRHYYPKKVIW